MKLAEQLREVQAELKAPKGQYNSFGKYKYRSCEDILEAVKPLLQKHQLTLTISDQIVTYEGRVYVQATASVGNSDGESIHTSAFAREPFEKKGMDESQITGTASSYARKYALNGLFLIDDTKDADTDENRMERDGRQKKTTDRPLVSEDQINELMFELQRVGWDVSGMLEYINQKLGYSLKRVEEMKVDTYHVILPKLKARPDKR